MIKHVVMFRVSSETAVETRASILIQLKTLLEALPSKINVIQSFECGINVLESTRAYDFVLISEFKTIETLNEYQIHADHVKVSNFIKEQGLTSVAVDYKY